MNWETIIVGIVIFAALSWMARDFILTARGSKSPCENGSCSCGARKFLRAARKNKSGQDPGEKSA